jgi:hypothetical protein
MIDLRSSPGVKGLNVPWSVKYLTVVLLKTPIGVLLMSMRKAPKGLYNIRT